MSIYKGCHKEGSFLIDRHLLGSSGLQGVEREIEEVLDREASLLMKLELLLIDLDDSTRGSRLMNDIRR